MSKITLIMDFFSGLLLAYDFLPKSGALQRFHDGLRKRVEKLDTNDPTRKDTIFFNIIISCLMFLLLLCWAYYRSKNTPDVYLSQEMLAYLVGSVIAFIILTAITKLVRNQLGIFIVGLVLVILSLTLLGKLHPSDPVVAGLIALIYMFIFFPFATMSANYIRRGLIAHPEKEYYIFAVLGLVLFVASNLIQISVDP